MKGEGEAMMDQLRAYLAMVQAVSIAQWLYYFSLAN